MAVTIPSLDDDVKLPLVRTVYIGHPAAIDQTGAGLAKTIIDTLTAMGFSRQQLRLSLKGGCIDGGVFNVNVSH